MISAYKRHELALPLLWPGSGSGSGSGLALALALALARIQQHELIATLNFRFEVKTESMFAGDSTSSIASANQSSTAFIFFEHYLKTMAKTLFCTLKAGSKASSDGISTSDIEFSDSSESISNSFAFIRRHYFSWWNCFICRGLGRF